MRSSESGPSLWTIWGEMREGFGRLEAAIVTNDKHHRQRQDDMRRETLDLLGRLERRLDGQPKPGFDLDIGKMVRRAPLWVLSKLWPPSVVAALGYMGVKTPAWLSALLAAF